MMKKTHLTLLALALSAPVTLVGCGDDDGDTMTGDDMFTPGTDMFTPPDEDMFTPEADMFVPEPEPRGMDNPPTIGAQIDRVGRPGVTTALVGTFSVLDATARGDLKDDYNADTDPSTWADDYAATIAANLAVLDGLDRNCGNQLAYDAGYEALAALLAGDELWINGASTTCDDTYLGVELEALGAITDGGCGGREPAMDVIDITYTALAAGALDASIGDGVPLADEDGTFSDTFPFLAAP